jgi:glycosyltransferase involved in cell wall biosynthesis
MHETTTAFLHFDSPQQELSGGMSLPGWLVAKPGHHYADVRVVAGAAVFPGVYGIPRRDLAEFFKSDRPFLLAGFALALDLPAGRHRLAFEGLALGGAWEPLGPVELEVPATVTPPSAHAELDAGALDAAFGVLLRRLGTSGLPADAAAAALLRGTPRQHHLQHPPRPFHGHLDQPHLWARSLFGRLPVSGWVFHESLPIQRVFATTDLQAVQELKFGRATDFLAARSQGSALATHCGYDGFVDLPAQLPSPVAVRIYAELADGSWHLGSVARVASTDQEFAKQPLGPYAPLDFWRAWRALSRAMRAGGWRGPAGRLRWQILRRRWRAYASEAPRARPRAGGAAGVPGSGPVHLITHNLSLEGAPLFLLEYARELRRDLGRELAVTSDREGPLRREFEALGASVRVVDAAPLLAARDAGHLQQELAALGARLDLRPAGLVVANTLSAWWGVHLARQAGRPSLLYVHESTSPRSFFLGLPAGSPVVPAAEGAFRLADRVSFLTASTQAYYAGLSNRSNYRLNPGWIDLARIDAFRAAHRREELRARLGLSPHQRLVINVGTVCERKGQHLFARAVDLLWQTAPGLAADAVFLMIGGRDTPYDRELVDFLARLHRPNLRVLPETGDVYPYYGAADLFACSSYEESFPRVVLEAMAFGVPIVSTGVHGIPEMARAGQEALLVPPGDTVALATALQRLLASPATGRELAESARQRVAAVFDSRVVLPRHLALARELLSGAAPVPQAGVTSR